MKKIGNTNDQLAKKLTNDPAYLAGGTTQKLLDRISFDTGEGREIPGADGFVQAIQAGTTAIQEGDLSHLEAILYAQIETLNTVFQATLNQANATQYLESAQHHYDCALKAQNQCRRTILALAELKNPKKATFIRQQNNAVNQQINSENSSHSESKVMEVPSGERMDRRTAQATIIHDSGVETLGFIDRTEVSRREKTGIAKRD
jgi:hypothetical protein